MAPNFPTVLLQRSLPALLPQDSELLRGRPGDWPKQSSGDQQDAISEGVSNCPRRRRGRWRTQSGTRTSLYTGGKRSKKFRNGATKYVSFACKFELCRMASGVTMDLRLTQALYTASPCRHDTMESVFPCITNKGAVTCFTNSWFGNFSAPQKSANGPAKSRTSSRTELNGETKTTPKTGCLDAISSAGPHPIERPKIMMSSTGHPMPSTRNRKPTFAFSVTPALVACSS
mmetsp:Transcript_122776/g.354910  ORF Transcript_122776/g.354910 Transcript_122776/m.354910 type:complete len:230 (+) Transcript_122776:183-872(+)